MPISNGEYRAISKQMSCPRNFQPQKNSCVMENEVTSLTRIHLSYSSSKGFQRASEWVISAIEELHFSQGKCSFSPFVKISENKKEIYDFIIYYYYIIIYSVIFGKM